MHDPDCHIYACGLGGNEYCEDCIDFQNRRIAEIKKEIISLVTKFAMNHPSIDSPLNLLARELKNLETQVEINYENTILFSGK